MSKEEEVAASTGPQCPPAASSTSADLPAFFPTRSRAPPAETRPIRKLNGADDLLTRLRLVPLYNATVKQFLRNFPEKSGSGGATGMTASGEGSLAPGGRVSGNGMEAGLDAQRQGEERGIKRLRDDESNPFGKGSLAVPGGEGSNTAKRKGLPKTIENYVADLPGRVMPPRKLLSKPDYHEQTMREIIYRPETTIQNIIPFDRETLDSAFRVSAGEVAGIDLGQLEPDQMDSSSPRKKRKSKSKQKPHKG
ncbi:hypothetical protein CF319_g3598 [Tilletia indica]|nr:hypothetical protein CF319_g3598 [Tilletia indica]